MSDDGRFATTPAAAAQTQVERTRLAWRRTGLTMTIVAALGARGLVQPGPAWVRIGVLICIALVLLGLTLIVQQRIRTLTSMQEDPTGHDLRPGRRQPVVVAGLALALALAAALEVLLLS